MDINTDIDILSFEINFVTLFHGCVGCFWILLLSTNIDNQLIHPPFSLNIIGRGAPCGKGRDHSSRRAHHQRNTNIVTTKREQQHPTRRGGPMCPPKKTPTAAFLELPPLRSPLFVERGAVLTTHAHRQHNCPS